MVGFLVGLVRVPGWAMEGHLAVLGTVSIRSSGVKSPKSSKANPCAAASVGDWFSGAGDCFLYK